MDVDDVTPDLPEVLYHYTGIEGLEGIWSGSQLWSTEAFYLNDTSELQLGLNYALIAVMEELNSHLHAENDRIRAHYEEHPDGFRTLPPSPAGFDDRVAMLERARGLLSEVKAYEMGFVVSLSEEGDQLSQWRAYADGGYCLGFSTARLRSALVGDQELRRVEYPPPGDKSQLHLSLLCRVEELIADSERIVNDEDDDDEVRKVRDFYIRTQILKEAAFIKDYHFREEKEVRIAETVELPSFFTAGKYGMTPRRKIELPPDALVEVVVGPGAHSEQRLRSMFAFFSIKHGDRPMPKIRASRIPYRNW